MATRYSKALGSGCLFLSLGVLVLSAVSAAFALPASEWPVVARGEEDTNNVRVTMLQYLLRQRGYGVRVDGVYGLETQRQVRRFQHSRRLRATGAVGSTTWRELIMRVHRGQQGEAVRAVQSSLQQSEERDLTADGRFGSRTERAVRAFQQRSGLRGDGIVGPETWLRLTDAVPD